MGMTKAGPLLVANRATVYYDIPNVPIYYVTVLWITGTSRPGTRGRSLPPAI